MVQECPFLRTSGTKGNGTGILPVPLFSFRCIFSISSGEKPTPGKMFCRGCNAAYSGKVVAISIHDFGPRRHEVFHELLLGIRAGIDFRESAQLRV